MIPGYLWVTSFTSCLNKEEIARKWFSIFVEDGEQPPHHERALDQPSGEEGMIQRTNTLILFLFFKSTGEEFWMNKWIVPPFFFFFSVKSPSSRTKNGMHNSFPTVKAEEVDIRNPASKIGF